MKKIVLIIALILIVNNVSAQFTIGPKVGLNVSKEYFGKKAVDDDVDFRMGLNAGVFGRYKISRKFDIQAELLYSQQGYKHDISLVDIGGSVIVDGCKVLSHYLNVPVLLKYYPIKNLFIEVGPQIGFCFDSKIPSEYKGMDDFDLDYNTVDFSLAGGIGVYLGYGLSFDVRYNHGFTKTVKSSEWENRVIQFSLAYDLFSF